MKFDILRKKSERKNLWKTFFFCRFLYIAELLLLPTKASSARQKQVHLGVVRAGKKKVELRVKFPALSDAEVSSYNFFSGSDDNLQTIV